MTSRNSRPSKTKRELQRLKGQLLSLPRLTYEYLTYTRKTDTQSARERRISTGALPLSGEVAIYLIFPSNGLLASHLQALKVMQKDGINPVVVSNLPLSAEDRDHLLPYCARIIERPNMGYDFGGYREAVLYLADKLAQFDRLFILNDSVWMLDAPTTWFAEARARGVDFCGATSHYAVDRVAAHAFMSINWRYSTDHKNFYYASYALCLGQRVLQDPAFVAFWRKLRLSLDKARVVRRGEAGLSQLARRQGWSMASTFDLETLDRQLAALSDTDIDTVFANLVLIDATVATIRRTTEFAAKDTPEGRHARIQFILMAVSRLAAGYTLPYYAINFRGFQFLKKSPLWLTEESSDTTLRILSGLSGPMAQQAREEARAIRAACSLPPFTS